MRGGQEQFDAGADTDTPAGEAREPSNDMAVNLLPPPPSGSGGGYQTTELSSSTVASPRGTVLGTDTSGGYGGNS